MLFHLNHGSAIQLLDGQATAQRDESQFGNGIVFSDSPLKANQRVCIEIACSSAWSGAIRIGLTTHNPARLPQEELPRFAYPDFLNKDGYWVRVINESLTSQECHLMLYMNNYGHLQLFINGQHKGVLLQSLPATKDLWLLFDIYGNTKSAKFVLPDNVPTEIQARGPEAVDAYEQACTFGTQPVHRTRLMLVGQEKAGKTSLKRALTGQNHETVTESTDGIDLTASCSLSTMNPSSWKIAVKGDETVRRERLQDSVDLAVLGGIEGLEEEYNRAVANNFVQEMLFKQKNRVQVQESQNSSDNTDSTNLKVNPSDNIAMLQANGVITPQSSKEKVTEEIRQFCSIHESIPDRVVALVTEILSKNGKRNRGQQIDGESKPPLMLNIWDFAGHSIYYTTHQVFLSSRAVYCFVFNLCDNLYSTETQTNEKNQPGTPSMSSVLDSMDFWMQSIHAHAAENTTPEVDSTTLSPPIFVVGTHRDSLDPDPTVRDTMIAEKFGQVREFLIGKPYAQHVVLPFFAVEHDMLDTEDEQIDLLRKEIDLVAGRQPYMGEQMPVKWLRFEQDLTLKAESGINFASYSQVYEMAVNHNITATAEVKSMLNFYHDLGMLIYYGNSGICDPILNATVVLNPQWLVDMFKKVTASFPAREQWNLLADKWSLLAEQGILEETLVQTLWSDVPTACHSFLLELMSKFDIICPRLPAAGQSHRQSKKSFYVPSRFGLPKEKKKIYAETVHDTKFYIDFNGFLPDGLFHRIQARTIRWSQEHGGRDLFLARGVARVYVDADHDLLLEKSPWEYHRIKVLVMHVKEKEATSSKRNTSPMPETVAKVRNFLETSLNDLRIMWMKRMAYKLCCVCPCDLVCHEHLVQCCIAEECLHFLDLNECVTSQVVCCEHRRVRTETFKKWFPPLHSKEFREPILSLVHIGQGMGNIERHVPNLPSWLKGAAKLLNGASDNQDWLALARVMGYKQGKIDMLYEDLNPSLALLTDWIVSSGNTSMSVDVLLHYLIQLGCQDVVDVVTRAKENELERPQVFISYQWDQQDEVVALREFLENSGFSCWMDIGQMGGGDQLCAKIEQGIRGCKMLVACISPKYTASQLCHRELCLADMLHKPIIPVMIETVCWPPPSAMAVILAQLLFIDMKGVGGHGGCGIHADLNDKYKEVVHQVSLYAEPDLTPCVDTTVVKCSEPHHIRSERLSDRLSGYRTSMSSLSEVDFQRQTSQYDSSLDVMLSRYDESHENSGQQNNNNSTTNSRRPRQSLNTVPQANVQKCAVCHIL